MFALFLLAAAAAHTREPCPLATDLVVPTADGADIALHHHFGKGPPVLMVHGVSSNHRFWDLDAEHSAARWLAARGHDVWLLDLRGHGNARRRGDGVPQISGWTVDDYGLYDVAAAVDYVRVVTRHDRVGYVGHSMGGMVGAIYAINGGAAKLSSMVMVGSPGRFARDTPMMELARMAMILGGGGLFWVEAGLGGDLAAALGPATPGKLQYRLYNPDNFARLTERKMLESIVSPMSREEMQHFGRMLTSERFESADGTRHWTAEMAGVSVPLLAIAGGADEVGRPEFVQAWVESAGGNPRYLEVPDYGHLDLGLGEDAERDVFPAIDAFLRETGWDDRR